MDKLEPMNPSNPISFGTYHLIGTGLGAGFGAAIGAAAGAIFHFGTQTGAGIGAGVGAATAFMAYPIEVMIDKATMTDVQVMDRKGNINKKRVHFSREDASVADVANVINNTVITGAVWGGAVLLGVVSLPIAGFIAGYGALSLAASKLEDVAIRHSGDFKPVVGLITLAAKIAIIAVAVIIAIKLSILIPPVGIALGVLLGVGAVCGTIYSLIGNREGAFYADSAIYQRA